MDHFEYRDGELFAEDLRVADLFADPRLYAVEVEVLRECLRVMRALRLRPVDLPGTPVRALALAAERLPRFVAQPALTKALGSGRGDKMPSFHIDLHSGRGRSEVEYLNGAVVRHGAEAITTNCGFLALFQKELAEAVRVPVATSSMMQVPWVQSLLPPGQRFAQSLFQ